MTLPINNCIHALILKLVLLVVNYTSLNILSKPNIMFAVGNTLEWKNHSTCIYHSSRIYTKLAQEFFLKRIRMKYNLKCDIICNKWVTQSNLELCNVYLNIKRKKKKTLVLPAMSIITFTNLKRFHYTKLGPRLNSRNYGNWFLNMSIFRFLIHCYFCYY